MELYKNIYFNTDNLTVNSKVKVCYTGILSEGNTTADIYLHYGFGSAWENSAENKMQKTDLGYETEIEIKNYDTFNFCFRDAYNNWDNNENNNYTVTIQSPIGINQVDGYNTVESTITNTEGATSYNSSINTTNVSTGNVGSENAGSVKVAGYSNIPAGEVKSEYTSGASVAAGVVGATTNVTKVTNTSKVATPYATTNGSTGSTTKTGKTLYPIIVSNNSLTKRIKNLIYKIIKYIPKVISGTFTKKKTSKN